MNHHFPQRQRSSLLTRRIGSLLAILVAVSWAISFISFMKLHDLDINSLYERAEEPHKSDSTANLAAQEEGIKSDDSSLSSKDVHIVFSTDCSGYQHWQSIASYYSFRRAGHLGPVTRVVSGCKQNQEEAIRTEFGQIQQHSSNNQLRLHFTPSFALGGSHYKYSNKPGGLYHWMNHTTIDESVVALVDPDMMAMRPILPQLGEGMTALPVTRNGYGDLVEYKDNHGRILLLRQKRLPPLPARVSAGGSVERDGGVSAGVGAGQHFGLGGLWASAGFKNARPGLKDFNLTIVCGANSPCLNDASSDHAYTTRELADKNYAVGPVYIASTADWMSLLPRWHDFTPKVHAQYPKLLAEMYAFTMSAADMQLKFALSSSYMVSDPGTMSTTEGWLWIDEYAKHDQSSMSAVCDGATSNSLPTETLRRLNNYGYGNYHASHIDSSINSNGGGALPTVLHYCQNYKLANHTFAKRKLPPDFFRCNGSPLNLDVKALVQELDSIQNDASLSEKSKKKEMRTAFMLCHLIPLMNMALEDYKSVVC